MKKTYLKHGFEVIFSLSLMAILALPAIVFAQNQKDLEITIQNGDTTVNGKKIKELTLDEREAALNDINKLNGSLGDGSHRNRFYFRQGPGDRHREIITEGETMGFRDSSGHALHIRKRFDGDVTNGPHERSLEDHVILTPPPPAGGWETGRRFGRRNVQSFNYTTTGTDGIATHVSFHVSDVNDNDDETAKTDKGTVQVTDLALVPQFSTGKTLLMFTLPGKGIAEVSLTDSDAKQLWSEKATSASFKTAFVFPFNGIYFLHIKQGGKTLTKRIIKD